MGASIIQKNPLDRVVFGVHNKEELTMETSNTTRETVLMEKSDVLIAIGAATAANCIPCFEHLYEKAVTIGIPADEIRRASQIAGLIKNGAHTAISSSIDELLGSKEASGSICGKTATATRCCC